MYGIISPLLLDEEPRNHHQGAQFSLSASIAVVCPSCGAVYTAQRTPADQGESGRGISREHFPCALSLFVVLSEVVRAARAGAQPATG